MGKVRKTECCLALAPLLLAFHQILVRCLVLAVGTMVVLQELAWCISGVTGSVPELNVCLHEVSGDDVVSTDCRIETSTMNKGNS